MFLFLSLVQVIMRGSLCDNKLFLNLLIAFNLVPLALGTVSIAFFEEKMLVPLLTVVLSSLGILITYSIWYAEKNVLDKLKMFWVVMFSISRVGAYIFKTEHWPYQDIITNVDLMAYFPLLIVFYQTQLKSMRGEK